MENISIEEQAFFNEKTDELLLYECLREKVLENCGQVGIQVKKTQISFINKHMFGAVSFLPVRRKKDRPKNYITVTFGLDHRHPSARIDAASEPYPNRWTHHIIVGNAEEIDDELISWLKEAAEFSGSK